MIKNNFTALLILVLFWAGAAAQDQGTKAAAGRQRVTLEEISRLALENSLDIQIARLDASIAATDLDKELSVFDFFLNGDISLRNNEKKVSSALLGSRTDTKSYSLALRKKLLSGTEIDLSATEQRTSTDSSFVSSSPEKEAVLGISAAQPLARNFFGLSDRAKIKITRLDISRADYTSLDDIETALSEVQKAYWALALRNKELAIREALRLEAERLYSIYQENFKLGLVEEGDLYAVEANLRIRENEVIQAELARDTVKNNLLFLLNISDTDLDLDPAEQLETSPLETDFFLALNSAVRSRRDFQKALLSARAQDIRVAVNKNSLWPEIDLKASYTRNGIDPDRANAWDQVKNEDYGELYIGLNFSTSLERTGEKADLKSALLKKEQELLFLKRIERLILKDINNRVRETNSLKSRIELFAQVSVLQEKKLGEEMKKLKYGRSSSDLVIRYEDDLLQAKLALAQAYYAFRVSLIDLDLAQNTLLDKYWNEPPAAEVESRE